MSIAATPAQRLGRIGLRILIGGAVLGSLAGVYAFKTIFARPGESALRLIPADSIAVGSLDLSPSPAQALTFKKIDDALSRNGMDALLDHGIVDIVEHGPIADAVRPLTQRNAAFAFFRTSSKPDVSPSAVLLLSVTDGHQVADLIKSKATLMFYKGLQYYKSPTTKTLMVVYDDLLVFSDSPSALYRLKQVRDGNEPAITSDKDFTAARNSLASDSNLMVFASPRLGDEIKPNGKPMKLGWAGWYAVGAAIRDGGVEINVNGKLDPVKSPEFKALCETLPVRRDLFSVLPSGAYGVTSIAQPANYFEVIKSVLKNASGNDEGVSQLDRKLQDSIGVDLQHDILPALKGNAILAAYPTQQSPSVGIDLLAIVDDSNGADPSVTVEKLQNFVAQQMSKDPKNAKELFVSSQTQGATKSFRLADSIQSDMRKGFGDGMDPKTINKDVLVNDKTLAWAIVDHAVIASTSQGLLDRAVASYKSKTETFASDSALGTTGAGIVEGSQTLAIFSLSRIAEGIDHTLTLHKTGEKGDQIVGMVIDMFSSLKEPLNLRGHISPDGSGSGGAFIPLDYDKLINLIGKAKS